MRTGAAMAQWMVLMAHGRWVGGGEGCVKTTSGWLVVSRRTSDHNCSCSPMTKQSQDLLRKKPRSSFPHGMATLTVHGFFSDHDSGCTIDILNSYNIYPHVTQTANVGTQYWLKSIQQNLPNTFFYEWDFEYAWFTLYVVSVSSW